MKSRADLLDFQREVAAAVFRPLTSRWRMHRDAYRTAAELIKPSERMTAAERLEVYNRQYWYRLLDCLYEDYPGLLALFGLKKFLAFARDYLAANPPDSFALRDLGNRIVGFLQADPHWSSPRDDRAIDMARFEWAQIVAFDARAVPPLTADEVLEAAAGAFRISLQPHVCLLALSYPVDEYLVELKNRSRLRNDASNAVSRPDGGKAARKIRPPSRQRVFLAVHRHDNMLYFKRLEPEAFAILEGLRDGASLEDACGRAVAVSRNPDADWPALIRQWFTNWSSLGWLCRIS